LAEVLFKRLEPPGAAKLVRPPPVLAAAPNPPLKPANPELIPPNPEDAAAANGEGPPAAANPVLGISGSVVAGFLNTDAVEPPMEPKGDCSELAKAAKLDEANADLEVV